MGRRAWGVVVSALHTTLLLLALSTPHTLRPTPAAGQAPETRLTAGRFTVTAAPHDAALARALLESAASRDTYPGLPRPRDSVRIEVAHDRADFRRRIGPWAPEWGAAIAFPEERRIVMQGRHAGSDAGDPVEVLRHELAHLALHETLGDLPPRWFDEGYASWAAGEWSREQVLETNMALALRGAPTFDGLEQAFAGGAGGAQQAYALSYRAVAELSALDERRGLAPLFVEWKRAGRLDPAVRAAYGITLDGFEKRWQERTRRRYGVLALAAEVTIATALLLVIVLPLYAIRKRRDRQRMAALVAADRAADAADMDVLGALLGPEPAEPSEGENEAPPPTAERPT